MKMRKNVRKKKRRKIPKSRRKKQRNWKRIEELKRKWKSERDDGKRDER